MVTGCGGGDGPSSSSHARADWPSRPADPRLSILVNAEDRRSIMAFSLAREGPRYIMPRTTPAPTRMTLVRAPAIGIRTRAAALSVCRMQYGTICAPAVSIGAGHRRWQLGFEPTRRRHVRVRIRVDYPRRFTVWFVALVSARRFPPRSVLLGPDAR